MGLGGLTVILSVQIGINWNWPTGTELGNRKVEGKKDCGH